MRRWREVIGVLLSAGLLWWVLHKVPFREVIEHLRVSNPWLWLAAVVAATGIFPLRALRWRVILSPLEEDIPFGPLWRSTASGMAINNVLPARVGELVRAFALARERPSITFSAAFASLAVDRVFDAVVTTTLTVIALLDPRLPKVGDAGRHMSNAIGFGTVLVVGLLGLLYLVVFFPQRVITLYEWFARRVAPRFEERGRSALVAFAAGLSVLRSPARFAAVLAWTFAHWMLNAFAFWLGFRAVGIDVSYTAALLVQGILVFAVAVPSSPGFFGVFEAAAQEGLVQIYHVDRGLAVGWALGFHLMSFVPITAFGLYYFFRLGLHVRDIKRPPADTQ